MSFIAAINHVWAASAQPPWRVLAELKAGPDQCGPQLNSQQPPRWAELPVRQTPWIFLRHKGNVYPAVTTSADAFRLTLHFLLEITAFLCWSVEMSVVVVLCLILINSLKGVWGRSTSYIYPMLAIVQKKVLDSLYVTVLFFSFQWFYHLLSILLPFLFRV